MQVKVFDFMKRYWQITPEIKAIRRAIADGLHPPAPSAALVSLRDKLTKEEFDELGRDYLNNDIIGVADAFGDTLYVVLGAAISFGCECDPGEHEFRAAPMSPDCSLVGMGSVMDFEGRCETFNRFWEQAMEHVCEWKPGRHHRIESKLKSCVFWCISNAHTFGIDIRRVFDAIHEANMSKVWLNSDILHINPAWSVEPLGDGRQSIVRNEFGKVIKPPNWQAPDLHRILFPPVVPTSVPQSGLDMAT